MLIKSVLLNLILRYENVNKLCGNESPVSIKVTPPNRKLSLRITYEIECCEYLTALSCGGRKPDHLWTFPAVMDYQPLLAQRLEV